MGLKYTFELLRGPSGQWYWRTRHKNGKFVAYSGEVYKRRVDAKRALVRLIAAMADEDFEIAEEK